MLQYWYWKEDDSLALDGDSLKCGHQDIHCLPDPEISFRYSSEIQHTCNQEEEAGLDQGVRAFSADAHTFVKRTDQKSEIGTQDDRHCPFGISLVKPAPSDGILLNQKDQSQTESINSLCT